MENYFVYMHTNRINGKIYIGKCKRKPSYRWGKDGSGYLRCSQGHEKADQRHFANAIKKYGWDNFIHIVIKDNMSIEEADIVEKQMIELFNTINNGYNLKEGGARGELSPESLKKMSDSVRRGFREHPERVEKIRQKAIGRPVSENTRRKLSNNSVSSKINIDGEIGSIRYWAKRIKMTHPPLLYRKKKYGMENLISYIKERL